MEDNSTISKWLGEHKHYDAAETIKNGDSELYWAIITACSCGNVGYIWHYGQNVNADGEWRHETRREHEIIACQDNSKDYSGKESAWTPELYGRIEETGLWHEFTINLIPDYEMITKDMRDIHRLALCRAFIMQSVRATPAQKAQALSRAITEIKEEEQC